MKRKKRRRKKRSQRRKKTRKRIRRKIRKKEVISQRIHQRRDLKVRSHLRRNQMLPRMPSQLPRHKKSQYLLELNLRPKKTMP